MTLNRLEEMDLNDKRVLIRVDLNLPILDGRVTDKTRIEKILPTIKTVINNGGLPILISHLGRPNGKYLKELSLSQFNDELSKAIRREVIFAADCVGPSAEIASKILKKGQILLLENTRFHKGEEKNDRKFAAKMALFADVFCNDAFSSSHRAHASTEALAKLLPSCAGLLMQAELRALKSILENPKAPVVAVLGGSKISTKLSLIKNLMRKVDFLIIGGAMANTFLAAKNMSIGRSLIEKDMLQEASHVLGLQSELQCEIILPLDVVVAKELRENAFYDVCLVDECPEDKMILDIGPDSIKKIISLFEASNTLVWNGPLGAFELEPFDRATNCVASAAAKLTRDGSLISVAGGGDTFAALNKVKASEMFSYVSSGGGAFLEWMQGNVLPGIAALAN